MAINDGSVEILLSTLRDNFLNEMPDRCDAIEDNILALESKDKFSGAFEDLFRSIHSIKGSGGTMGLPIITAISHQFEDMLSETDGKFEKLRKNTIDSMLKYNDLLKSTTEQLANKNFDEEAVRVELAALKASNRRQETSCIIVDPSKMLSRAITKELQNLPFHVTFINNGLGALERLLNEKYDVLVTSKELPILNGIALISAIRKSESKNANIPCILTTSKTGNAYSLDKLEVSSVVIKDTEFVISLKNELQKINAMIT